MNLSIIYSKAVLKYNVEVLCMTVFLFLLLYTSSPVHVFEKLSCRLISVYRILIVTLYQSDIVVSIVCCIRGKVADFLIGLSYCQSD